MKASKRIQAVAAVSMLALAACAQELEMDKVKGLISSMIQKQVGATVKNVTCPEKREMKAGDTFECQAEIDHGKVPVTVTQKDASGKVSAELKQLIIPATDLEKAVAANLKEQLNLEAVVDCGPRFRPSVPGESFDCTSKTASGPLTTKVTVKDEKGNVTFATTPPAAAPGAPAEE